MSRVLAGPLCGMALGDLGADVIKVERPGSGDETRSWGPPYDARGETAYYLSTNRNKLGIALDLDVPSDRNVLRRLIDETDVVIENFKAPTRERTGLHRDTLLQVNQRLIWLTMTGFGAASRRLGYDIVAQAECGWMAITGAIDGEPMKVGVALADVIAGKDAALAVAAALAARELAAGPLPVEARRIEISLAHSAVAALVNVAQNVLVSGNDALRHGNAHPNLVPYQAFRARDRHIIIAVGNDRQWLSCCAALDLPELASDTSLSANSGRIAARDRVTSQIADRVAHRDAANWVTRLNDGGVPCGIVRTVQEALLDVSASPLTGVWPSIPGSVRFPPPMLDEHGAAIRQMGWAVFKQLGVAG